MTILLQTDQLNVGYDGDTVISDVNITALRGQFICLLGPNGAGKSTILRTLSGHLAPLSGTVYINGKSLTKINERDRAQKLSIVLTDKLSLPMTTVYEFVAMGRMPYTNFWGSLSVSDHTVVENALKIIGISSLAGRYFMELSDGEKQKALIARALAQEPEMIILDEPTSHLDISSRIEIICILDKLARMEGLTIIMSIHDMDVALKICQSVILVKDGRLLCQESPEKTINDNSIAALYGIKNASYDSLLGSVEIHNLTTPTLFIAAGAGSGIPVYRALTRAGLGFTTGILHEGDIDCRVALDMGIEVVTEKPFMAVSRKTFASALQKITSFRYAVDAAFPVGRQNIANIKLLRSFLEGGGTLFSLRPHEENAKLYQENIRLRDVESAIELADIIKNIN